jgi:hypothetical protein
MVLGRSKRSNAGKAPGRLDEPALSTPLPPTQSKTSKKASSRSREESLASQASKSSKEAAPPAKRLVLSIKPQATQATQATQASSIRPASLRREEDILTVSESPEPLLSDDDSSEAA